jgi:NADH-quinone oxidoreductase subunit L
MYRNGPSPLAQSLHGRFTGVHNLLSNKYWIDEIYDSALVRPLREMSEFMWRIIDKVVIDGVVNGIGQGLVLGAGVTSFKMTGNLHRHAMVFVIGLVVFFVVILF